MNCSTSQVKTVDLFSGGGGLSLGFIDAKFQLVASYDNWAPAINLHRANFTHPIFDVDLSDRGTVANIIQFAPNVIIGGPPCQDYSSAGKRDESLGRSALTICFSEIVGEIKPQYFVMENVPRALTSITMGKAIEIFRLNGYGLTIDILNANHYGVPQIRKRLFVVGELGGEEGFLSELLEERKERKCLTVRDWVGESFGVSHYYRHPRSYKRRGVFSIDEPSPTIRGVNRPVPKGYPGHPGDTTRVTKELRSLTTKERSLIQTYPESFKLVGSKSNLEQIIGNAVPVNLARHVAEALMERIKLRRKHPRKPILTQVQHGTVRK